MPLPIPRWVISSPEPHDEAGARREREDDEGGLPVGEVRDQVDVRGVAAEKARGTVVEEVDEARGLKERQPEGQVPGRLGQLLLAESTLVTPFLELRDHRRQKLDDDRARDVGHDPEPEHGHTEQAVTGEEAQEAEDPGLLGLGLELTDGRRPRCRG